MIKFVVVGKIKEAYFRAAVQEYQKRLQKYGKFVLIEVPDSSLSDPFLAQEQEAKSILKVLDEKDFLVTLELDGMALDSVTFAKQLDRWQATYPNIVFLVGGSYGIANRVKQKSQYALSFSKMTFPHPLFRILLLEQVYRAFRILHNESYHK